MTTSNKTMSTWLQIKQYQEKCNIASRSIGSRAVHKASGKMGTIKRATVKEAGTLYYLSLDEMGSKVALALWEDALVIVGQSHY